MLLPCLWREEIVRLADADSTVCRRGGDDGNLGVCDLEALLQFPEGGFWELQYRETHGRRESQAWRPYAERITDTSVTVEGLVPGTSYDFQARGGFEGMGDITMGGFSVMATVQTTGKRPVPASSGATAAATATATPAQARASGKVPSKTARSTGEAGKASTGPVRSHVACS